MTTPPEEGEFQCNEFHYDKTHISLKEPLKCLCTRGPSTEHKGKDVWTYECTAISGSWISVEYDQQEAWDVFNEEFIFMWEEYACESDDKLAPDAIKLKQLLLNLIDMVIVEEEEQDVDFD